MDIQLEDEDMIKGTLRVQRPEVSTIRIKYICAVISVLGDMKEEFSDH